MRLVLPSGCNCNYDGSTLSTVKTKYLTITKKLKALD